MDNLLKDLSVKANRYYEDCVLYSLPLRPPAMPDWLVDLVLAATNTDLAPPRHAAPVTPPRAHYQVLEAGLVRLLSSNTLHWRHQEMGVGMLLSMTSYDHTPAPATARLWLSLLVSEQRTLRLMALQALDGVLKVSKLPSRKVPLSSLVPEVAASPRVTKPGVRRDNQCLQYQSGGDLETYWALPFTVKTYVGFHSWPGAGGKARLVHTRADYALQPDTVRGVISQFFRQESNLRTFVELSSVEQEKGADSFSTDRGLFVSFLLENLGPKLAAVFRPHIERLVNSQVNLSRKCSQYSVKATNTNDDLVIFFGSEGKCLRNIFKDSENYRSDEAIKPGNLKSKIYIFTIFQSCMLPILHSFNPTLLQSDTLPILHSSNLSLFQSFTLPILHSSLHSSNLTLF